MRLLLVLALAGLVWGSALADEAQQLRVEAAALVQAAERVSSVRERRGVAWGGPAASYSSCVCAIRPNRRKSSFSSEPLCQRIV